VNNRSLQELAATLAILVASTAPAAPHSEPGCVARVALVETGDRAVPTVVRQGCPAGAAAFGGGLDNGGFDDGLSGWTASQSGGGGGAGSIAVVAGRARFAEGDSFLVTLEQTFVHDGGASEIGFSLWLEPGFDRADLFLPDAFEASLLDASTGMPVVPAWDPDASAWFNVQEDGTVLLGAGTTWDGLHARADVSAVAPGTVVTLVFDLIGADADVASAIHVDFVGACVDADGDGVDTCTPDNCPGVANPAQADADGDGLGNACDACTDADADGAGTGGESGCANGPAADCDDANPAEFPGNPETCDGDDNDCNGLADDGNPDGGAFCDTGQVGVCADGSEYCQAGSLVCIADQGAGCELCGNGLDDDCDGTVDETTNDLDGDGIGDCGDNCCDVFNPGQEDTNGNGTGDVCDCSGVADVGDTLRMDRPPGPTLSWTALPDVDEYNVYRGVRGPGSTFAYSQQCFASNVAGTTLDDATEPLGGYVLFYLVTSRCAVGDLEGTLGHASSGAPRPQPFVCPDPTSDADGDGTDDAQDNCLGLANPSQSDVDGDAFGDVCDNCVLDANQSQSDLDGDGDGDACDPDQDGDGVPEDGDGSGVAGDAPCPDGVTTGCDDSCPLVPNPEQLDGDGDGAGDVCDEE
jgi:hypothetical protein